MSRKKRVLIAGNVGEDNNYKKALDHLGAEWGSGLVPSMEMEYDALLLPGGGDIDPILFGEPNCGSHLIQPELDRLQLAMIDAFVRVHKPVLGICKGHQVVNVYFGGKIIQDLPTAYTHTQKDGIDAVHMARAEKGSFLYDLYGEYFPVNSAHHQGNGTLGRGLKAIQYADDGVVEAMIHEELPVISVQWHPERISFEKRRPDAVDGSKLLAYFLQMIPEADEVPG